jgi:hypothetical protein
MEFTFDLTPRQAARVLEQALHTKAKIDLEVRSLRDGDSLHGALESRDGALLRVRVDLPAGRTPPLAFVGAFCEVRVHMGSQAYWFSSCIVDVSESHPVYFTLESPSLIQVFNRRRFERQSVQIATKVKLLPAGGLPAIVGLLEDIGTHGLACTLAMDEANEALLIGDPIRISFELPGVDQPFETTAIVCSKSCSKDKQLLTAGFEFAPDPNESTAQNTMTRLRQTLFAMMNNRGKTDDES